MVVSMTGFGRSKREIDSYRVTVEMKSVNHRFSEFHIRMPRQLLNIEDKLKKKMGEYVQRGRIELFVTVEGEGILNRKVNIDWNLLNEYYQNILKIQDLYNLKKDITLEDLLNREEFISIDEEEAGNKRIEALVLETTEEAVIQLQQMREIEGAALANDMKDHLTLISEKVHLLKKYAPNVVLQYKERLSKRMKEYSEGLIDESRLINEVAIFADKADINEELTRLNSHIEQFQKTLEIKEAIGRKLDFLLQEMNREVNTIGSKANDSSIAKEVVELKSLLEKIKEQVQNIE
ncbi:YicC/YloC family endoribonuclease [Bacillus sp. 31A1R]|uniref:YicC/YloC family endoribonuclease n=1 Tax=Robertmurraya mangrovi TaxID=3098077 RepID=A0ABU5J4Q3_9BACI|nr:YicC/YloC family endoribonuclease [Bacillus sp. 31A1R]MDZ5474399.1 YicC/YloC family endoribonuclease [Bacillus sp. 31A1R]